jgi:cation transport protein ChaC
MVLTRDNIKSGYIRKMIEAGAGVVPFLKEEELQASRQRAMAAAPEGDIWVFGYGSLMWNPAFHHDERRIARLHGFHRRFCLWTHLGRGSPDRPGLVLGLERGGSCTGLAYRIARGAADEELDIVWRREMVSGAYSPRWVKLRVGRHCIAGLTFVINHHHPRYTGEIAETDIVEAIAGAAGPLGPCADYLFNTVDHLRQMGIYDAPLEHLASGVKDRIAGA